MFAVLIANRQLFNLLATRTRRLSVFQQPPAFNKETQNLLLFPAMVFAIVIVFICKYTSHVSPSYHRLTMCSLLHPQNPERHRHNHRAR